MDNTPPFDVEQFINEVKSRRVLWDTKHPNFNHRQAKTSAWEDVALNLYADSENWSNYDKFGKVRDIQKRWKNMRDNYVKEIKYERKVQEGLAVAKRKRYVYSHLMEFLSPRKRTPSKSSSEKSSSEEEEEGEMEAEAINKASDSYMLMDEGYSSSHVNQFCKVTLDPHNHTNYVPEQPSPRANTPEPNSKASGDTGDAHPHRSNPDSNSRSEYIAQYSHRSIPVSHSCPDYTSPQFSHKNSSDPSSSRVVATTDLHSDSSSIPLEHDGDKMFLLSLLPYFKKFAEERKLQARINVTKLLHDMLYKQS